MDTKEVLRRKLHQATKEKLDVTAEYNEELSKYLSQIAKLRAEVEKGEAIRQSLEYDLAVARKEVGLERCSAEDKLCEANKQIEQLRATITAFQQKLNETERAFHASQQHWDDKQQRLLNDITEKDLIIKSCNSEYELLLKERTKLENVLKGNAACCYSPLQHILNTSR
uniref:Uncharacterized protein n=1 Tax=Sphaerodactylus townsendi TaxID=933632 RepID=A0ACB8ER85_9SAUR